MGFCAVVFCAVEVGQDEGGKKEGRERDFLMGGRSFGEALLGCTHLGEAAMKMVPQEGEGRR